MKKGLFIFILLLGAFVTYESDRVYADQAIVQVDHLNVRTGPSTNYDRIGQVQKNQSYAIVEAKGNWLKIKWNGKTGWVAKWLTKVKTESKASASSYTSKYDYLRIRSTAGLDGKIKGYLMKGDRVQPQGTRGKWFLIKKGNIEGWVHGDYLTKNSSSNSSSDSKEKGTKETSANGKVKVGTAVLNVRSGNSTKGKILTQVRKGQVYEYIAKKDRWYKIKYDKGKTGWVAGWLVNETSTNSDSSSGSETNHANSETYVSLDYNSTNIRNGPSTNHKVVGRAHKGDRFDVITKEGQWYKIDYKGKEAYVAGWIVKEQKESSDPTPTTPSGSLKGKTIMVDAGHGGRDSGAIGRSSSYEKNLTLDTAYLLKKELENQGAKVLMTRTKDEYISLSIRSYYAKSSNADAFLSLHYNSAPLNIAATGINSYYYHSKDQKLASSIQSFMISHTGLRNRGAKKGNFHVIRENNKPAVLLELGFLSDAREEQTLRTSSYQKRVSQGITEGLIHYFK